MFYLSKLYQASCLFPNVNFKLLYCLSVTGQVYLVVFTFTLPAGGLCRPTMHLNDNILVTSHLACIVKHPGAWLSGCSPCFRLFFCPLFKHCFRGFFTPEARAQKHHGMSQRVFLVCQVGCVCVFVNCCQAALLYRSASLAVRANGQLPA